MGLQKREHDCILPMPMPEMCAGLGRGDGHEKLASGSPAANGAGTEAHVKNSQPTTEQPQTSDALALIRKHELAALLGVNPWTLDYWRKKGVMPPAIVLGPQTVAWRRIDIEQWLLQRQQNIEPAPTRTPLAGRVTRKKPRTAGHGTGS